MNNSAFANNALLSRLRAGSMPQRSSLLLNNGNPFGNSVFASNWLAGRERASTLQSLRSSDAPSSPREAADNDVRTLDYLGLAETPQTGRGSLSRSDVDLLMSQQRTNGGQGVSIADLASLNSHDKNPANRFRSYSVNAKENYADDGDEDEMDQYAQLQQAMASGQLTPGSEIAAQQAAINEAIRRHNLEVQAFANNASTNRPRARTAGNVLDSPANRSSRSYLPTPSRLDNSISASDLQSNDGSEYNGLNAAVQNMQLNSKKPSYEFGPDALIENPTKALWLGNIPSSTTPSSLTAIFGVFGHIESARVLTHKSCGFVNFDNVQSAISARQHFHNREIFPGCGPVRIGFGKEQSASNTPGANGAYPSPSPDPFATNKRVDSNVASGAAQVPNVSAETAAAALATPELLELHEEVENIVQQFGASPDEKSKIALNLDNAMKYEYAAEMPPPLEPNHNRVHDAPRLRDIRKRIDNNSCSPMEVENIALEMLPEVAELSSDYLGNTVVQKLFEHCSEETKESMLVEIAPRLAEIGMHKNGTWAAQKIIDTARTEKQMTMIVNALKPYSVQLFLDQFGNYVMQCCLRFQAPLNNFIFDSMVSKMWEIAQGRFGSRAMRACLESHFATNDQKRMLAAAIALHSTQLTTTTNSALLLTWFLDTCTYPRRRSVLAPRLTPHLVFLCTHKVAYLTVLKIINQRNEPEARESVLQELFFRDQTLQQILNDQSSGATLIFKVLTTPFLDENLRPQCVENVRNVLTQIKAQPSQGYKRLMDEVGLSTRNAGTPSGNESRSSSKHRSMNGHLPSLDTNQNGYGRPPYNTMTPQQTQIDPGSAPGLDRTISMESNGFDPYFTPHYTTAQSPAISNAGISPINQQMQYQQNMLAQQQAQQPMGRPPGFYGSPGGMNGGGMGYGNASPAPQMMDPYRQNSPMVPPGMGMQGGYQQPPYGNAMMGMNGGYGQFAMPPPPPQPQYQMQGQMGGQRRGRVRLDLVGSLDLQKMY